MGCGGYGGCDWGLLGGGGDLSDLWLDMWMLLACMGLI